MTEISPQRPPLVETRGLTKRYGSITAVDSLGLTVGRGEVYGFLGPNGAGKTTTLRMLLGLIRPSGGVARVLGEEPGSVAELRGRAGGGLLVRADPPEEAARIAARLAGVEDVSVENGALRLLADPGRAAEINAKLVSAGLRVSELRPLERSLEEAFLEITGRETV